MKKIFTFIVMMTITLVMFAGDKTKTVFTLDHQMSEHCEKKIKSNLRYEKGVSDIDVSLKQNTITITYDKDKTNPEKLLAGFKKIGFNAEVVNPGASAAKAKTAGSCCGKQEGQCCGKKDGQCCGKNGGKGCAKK